jgi:uncharacterized cupin superfamily protein
MPEARITDTETGRVVEGEGWFVLNLAEASWERTPANGVWCSFEAEDARFAQYGIGVHILMPGEAPGHYHAESDQEGFLVLAGECIAIVEGQERRMRRWDYLHCPPGTSHITIGAGDGPCVILMSGARTPGKSIHYPVEPLAARHGASVSEPADSAREAYAGLDRRRWRDRAPWPLDGAR